MSEFRNSNRKPSPSVAQFIAKRERRGFRHALSPVKDCTFPRQPQAAWLMSPSKFCPAIA